MNTTGLITVVVTVVAALGMLWLARFLNQPSRICHNPVMNPATEADTAADTEAAAADPVKAKAAACAYEAAANAAAAYRAAYEEAFHAVYEEAVEAVEAAFAANIETQAAEAAVELTRVGRNISATALILAADRVRNYPRCGTPILNIAYDTALSTAAKVAAISAAEIAAKAVEAVEAVK